MLQKAHTLCTVYMYIHIYIFLFVYLVLQLLLAESLVNGHFVRLGVDCFNAGISVAFVRAICNHTHTYPPTYTQTNTHAGSKISRKHVSDHGVEKTTNFLKSDANDKVVAVGYAHLEVYHVAILCMCASIGNIPLHSHFNLNTGIYKWRIIFTRSTGLLKIFLGAQAVLQ